MFWPTMNSLMPSKERSFASRLFAYIKDYLSDSLSGKVVSLTACLLVDFWESCELLHFRGVLNFFLRFRSELATDVLHGPVRLDSKIRSQNVHFHDSFWREQTLAATKLFLSLTRIDFAVAVSSRAVCISSRAVRFFPALSLRRVRPSYGTFSLTVFQGNCARGRTGHMIRLNITGPHCNYILICQESTQKQLFNVISRLAMISVPQFHS